MSKKMTKATYENTFAYKFRRWMSGEQDPYLGTMEMKPQETPIDPEYIYQDFNPGEVIKEQHAYVEGKGWKRSHRVYIVLSVIVCVLLIAVLTYSVSFLPPVGDASNPTNNEVGERYIESGLSETGATNIVTGLILTYRVFDTFGETTVLFIATCCVMILLVVENEEKRKAWKLDEQGREPQNDVILQKVAKIVVPIIFMFGIYVIINGHLSPGGGFSGGAIVGAGMILYAAAYGFNDITRWFNEHIYVIIKVTALMIYGLIAVYFFVTGANGLESIFPLGVPGAILSGGIILPIDICVGAEVACTIYAFFALFKRGGL